MNELISVVVPIYNVEKYLPQCIESILNQQYTNIEVILVDDGSTDHSGKMCDTYAQKDKRIKVIHKENGGLVSARKAGIRISVGRYIGYVDGDDWIEPNMYLNLYKTMMKYNVDIAMCGRYEDTGDKSKAVYQGIPKGRYGKREMLENVYPRMIVNDLFFEWGLFPSVWDKLFKKECVEQFQLDVDERIVMGEDAACVYPCLLNSESIYVLHECLYHYRQTTSSMVKSAPDFTMERMQFQVMYRYTKRKLMQYKDIYNFEEQWNKYVLFLMTARADGLYRGYSKLDYLFPFSDVKRGEKIVLYGAGTYGQRLYKFLLNTKFCKVVAWVDQNYEELKKMGLNVLSPECVPDFEYDHIVVAITYAKARMGLYQILSQKYEKAKIALIDEELICSKETREAFGLE